MGFDEQEYLEKALEKADAAAGGGEGAGDEGKDRKSRDEKKDKKDRKDKDRKKDKSRKRSRSRERKHRSRYAGGKVLAGDQADLWRPRGLLGSRAPVGSRALATSHQPRSRRALRSLSSSSCFTHVPSGD